ncbi:LOW QUALITY PROTEIN: putative solute carrier family 22 member 31 [Pelodiscus sinensis]|uniref:LOW QUALITY PROTEIN: putative solute carrier family 22 member 31 n=1 Tax=Pelodiscus sinensis TaxID=13735 RepID=UPI003F6AF120
MEFDARLLRPAGGFGRRARLLAALSWLPGAALALGCCAGPLLAPPPHRCRPDPALLPPALRNLSGRALLAAALPRGAEGWSRCLLYRYAPGAALPNRTGPCTRGWHYEPPAAGLRASPATQWDLVCADGWKVPLEETTYLLGWLSGCIVLGLACDRFGRRATFVFSLVLAVPLGVGVALALNYIMLLSLRLLFGAMLAGTFLSLYVARLELCDPPHRLMVVMVAGLFWVAGELLLPGLAVLCRQWQLLQGALTLILALLATCWGWPALFPESPRWLLATRQLERGRGSLRALAEGNGVLLEDEFYSQEHLLAELEPVWEGAPLPQYHTLCEVFSTRVIWKNSLILGFSAFIGIGVLPCFTRHLAAYPPRFYVSYFLPVALEAGACLALWLSVDRFGRRPVLLLCTILTGLSALLLLALTQYLLDWIILSLSVLGIASSQAVTMLSIFFASEVLPTVVRGAGLGLIVAASLVGRAARPIMELQNNRGFFLHHVVFASFAILSVLSIMLLPESRGKGLPESLQDGESQRRPPLFRASRRRDQLPLLSPRGPAQDYARLVTATKKMLSSHRRSPRRGQRLLPEPGLGGAAPEEM